MASRASQVGADCVARRSDCSEPAKAPPWFPSQSEVPWLPEAAPTKEASLRLQGMWLDGLPGVVLHVEVERTLHLRVFMLSGEPVYDLTDGCGVSWSQVMHAIRLARADALGPASALVGICLVPVSAPDFPSLPSFVISGNEPGLLQGRCSDMPGLAGRASVDLTLVLTWLDVLDVTQAAPQVLAQFEHEMVTVTLRREEPGPVVAALAATLRGVAYSSMKAVVAVADSLLQRACQQGRLADAYLTVITALKDSLAAEEAADAMTSGGAFRRAVVGQLQDLFEHQLGALATPAEMSRMIQIVKCFAHCFTAGFSSRVIVAKVASDLLDQWPVAPKTYAEHLAVN